MSHQRVGTCSICGGDVWGHRGAWMSVSPPPPDRCWQCGAVAAVQGDVIPMVPRPLSFSSPARTISLADYNEFAAAFTPTDIINMGDAP